MIKHVVLRTLLLISCLMLAIPAFAATLYVTTFGFGSIDQILSLDTATKATSPLVNTTTPDSLVFDSSGSVIYTAFSAGEVRRFNPVTQVDSVLLGGLSAPTDLTLEPGGNTVLISDRGHDSLVRLNLTTLAAAPLGGAGAFNFPNGVVYDSAGRLFASLQNNHIVQIDPVTGAMLKTGAIMPGNPFLDGITFDPVGQRVWGSNYFGNCILSFDPATLGPGACVAGFSGPDGIVADGVGGLYVANRASGFVSLYSTSAGTITAVSNLIPGLDDIAPASGLGAAPSVPEPSTSLFAAVGLAAFACLWRKRHDSRRGVLRAQRHMLFRNRSLPSGVVTKKMSAIPGAPVHA